MHLRYFITSSLNIFIMNRPPRASTALTRRANSPPPFSNQKLLKKQQHSEYLTPRAQSFSAHSSRNGSQDLKQKPQSAKTQLRVQSKVPVMTSKFREEELKNRINKLGLQSFMKQIVLPQKMLDPQFSSKVIHALNRTYIEDEAQYQKTEFRPSFGKKSLRDSRRLQNPRVNWNPQKGLNQTEFKQFDYHIPIAMFPCRRQKTTKLLKSKYKKKEQIQDHRPKQDMVSKLLHSQSNQNSFSSSVNLNDRKSIRNQLQSSSSERKKKQLLYLNLSQYSKTSFMRNSQQKKSDHQSMFYCRRARIYV